MKVLTIKPIFPLLGETANASEQVKSSTIAIISTTTIILKTKNKNCFINKSIYPSTLGQKI